MQRVFDVNQGDPGRLADGSQYGAGGSQRDTNNTGRPVSARWRPCAISTLYSTVCEFVVICACAGWADSTLVPTQLTNKTALID